jgi:hypothetical protein
MSQDDKDQIEAIYIFKSGFAFHSTTTYPHQNHLILAWQEEGHAEPYLELEFVYFGHYRNRIMYHEIDSDGPVETSH